MNRTRYTVTYGQASQIKNLSLTAALEHARGLLRSGYSVEIAAEKQEES